MPHREFAYVAGLAQLMPQWPQDHGSFNLTINAIITLPFHLSSIAAGLFQGVERLQASHHVTAAVPHADSHILQPTDVEKAETTNGDPLPLRDDDGRALIAIGASVRFATA